MRNNYPPFSPSASMRRPKISESNEWNGKLIGGFKVFCFGKYIRSPDFPCCLVTCLIIIIPSIVHIVFTYDFLEFTLSY